MVFEPARWRTKLRYCVFGSSSSSTRTSQRTMAPALMKGLRGMPCSCSSWTRELNGSPEGSTSTLLKRSGPSARLAFARRRTLVMLWMEKRSW